MDQDNFLGTVIIRFGVEDFPTKVTDPLEINSEIGDFSSDLMDRLW